MAYQIDRYNNTLLTNVEDGTVDQTTDLKFIGKNYAGYGEIQNENFLFLLENFSGATAPAKPLSGQVWYDSSVSKLKFYDGTKWRTNGGSEAASTEPTGLSIGDFWFDTTNNQLYVYNGTIFVLIGPQNAGSGITQMQSLSLLDTGGTTRNVIAGTINSETVMLISTNEFDIAASNSITGFDRVKKGITLVNTQLASNGVTTPAGHYFWGTASDSLRLGGVLASNFIQQSSGGANTVFTTTVEFPDSGIQIGNSQDLQLLIENGTEGVIQNVTGNNSKIKVKSTNGSGTTTHSVTFDSTGITPAVDNTFALGSGSLKFSNVYATNFTGEASQATALRVGTDFRTASASASNNTVAVRDATGNIAANLFQGTATQARYADLAENYLTDEIYPVGTAMAVGGDAEARSAKVGDYCIGVISENPAYLMNSEAGGQAIGLKGRVPVRVNGPVSKGQAVFAWKDGVCSTITTNALVGIALETSTEDGEKLVECVLKV
ncbi:MAG: hypothetical protein CMG35_12100 [Candidatus Marinimicrobia bacterium]|jgi:hypothetical protein|nr:hypothetical protein [Candidatus Neomarinimicrobiota bacterium]MBO03374.1 hypothetical protein [Candidatus Neomarinimicrobiota bacterium]|tara:strand:- start:15505 stop:16980 length:1476 start_codon:yes stop_codon:yes gene_type:complete